MELSDVQRLFETQTRRCSLIISYNGNDITHDISQYIESFTYTERAINGESDDLSLTLRNEEQLWNNSWFPDRGAKVTATIMTEHWYETNDHTQIDCGSFEIDDITESGPVSTFSIGALSVGITSSIRGELKSKAWESFKFSALVNEIANRHGFNVFFDSGYDPVIDRYDQKNESDLSFLLKVAEYVGVQVRLSHGKIVVYQESLYDAKEVSMTIDKNYDGYIGHSFRASSADIYLACHVQYLDSKKGKLLTYQYMPDGRSGTLGKTEQTGSSSTKIDPVTRMVITDGSSNKTDEIAEPSVGKILKINRRCSNLAEAEQLAKSALRGKNKREITGAITFVGNLYFRAGLTIAIANFGRWDSSKFTIESVSHSWDKQSGLVTEVSLRGILGY